MAEHKLTDKVLNKVLGDKLDTKKATEKQLGSSKKKKLEKWDDSKLPTNEKLLKGSKDKKKFW